MALTQSVSLITGGPGTGKTYVIGQLISIFTTFNPSGKIAVLAPTGIASENLSKKRNMTAMTIHRFLSNLESGKTDVLDHDFIIVDEFSMVDVEFRIGDKVIHGKNNYSKNVFNGQIGLIHEIKGNFEDILTVQFDSSQVSYTLPDVNDLDLAYATTIHKSQGSEYAVVIIPIHEDLDSAFVKNSLYTAITRAKERVILIGDEKALQKILGKEFIRRNSKISQRLWVASHEIIYTTEVS